MVQSLAQQDGKSIQYDQHTNGGWTWEKHATSAVMFVNIEILVTHAHIHIMI